MIRPILMMLSLVMLVACGSGAPPPTPTQAQIDVLAADIMALSSDIDPVEARQAAQIAYEYPLFLRMQYNVTDPPLLHNAKVNRGQRPRGLCFHWADDMEAEFKRQGSVMMPSCIPLPRAPRMTVEWSIRMLSSLAMARWVTSV